MAVKDVTNAGNSVTIAAESLATAAERADQCRRELMVAEHVLEERRKTLWGAMRNLGGLLAAADPVVVVRGRETAEVIAETMRGVRLREEAAGEETKEEPTR